MRWMPERWAATPVTAARLTPRRVGSAETGVSTTIAMIAASPLPASYYYAADSGRAGSNYFGAYIVLGDTDYVWWTHDGIGHDPGLTVAELSGLTGHEVVLLAGLRTGTQVATATAAVVAAVPGWDAVPSSADLRITGEVAATTGPGWDARGAAGICGAHVSRVDGIGYGEGAFNSVVVAQHFSSPEEDGRVSALDVLLGGTVDGGDLPRFALYQGGDEASPTGAALVHDFGQIAAPVANAWNRLYVPPDVFARLRSSRSHWIGMKSDGNVTQVGGYSTGSGQVGDFTSQPLQVSDSGMSTDPTDAFEASWTGTTSTQNAFSVGLRLVYESAPFVGNASHHSSIDPAIWGVHNTDPTELTSQVDINSLVLSGGTPFPMAATLAWVEIAVGTVHPASPQFRLAVYVGGSDGDPEQPDPNAATLLVDLGQTAGTATNAWVRVNAAGQAIAFDSLVWVATKCNDSSAGPTIRFAQDPNQIQGDALTLPMDFVRPGTWTTGVGPEYEIFAANHSHSPAVAYESPINDDGTDTWPGNLPGLRLGFYVEGMVAA